MKSLVRIPRLMYVYIAVLAISGCQTTILEEVPADFSIPSGKVVYAENDGRCSSGEVIKITGGNSTYGIPRKYECVPRPD